MYEKQEWVGGKTGTPATPERMNHLEEGIYKNSQAINGKEPMGSIVVEDVASKNIFDENTESIKYYYIDGGGIPAWDSGAIYWTKFFEVKPNTDYTISSKELTLLVVNEYDENETNITEYYHMFNRTGLSNTFKTSPNTKYVRISSAYENCDEIMLEKSSTATEYTPYKKFGYNETESMGNIVVDDISCKNKFNFDAITVPNGTVDYVNKTITVRTFANGTEQTLKQLCPDLEVGRTYALSFKTTGNSNFIHLFGSSTNWMNGTTHVVTQEDLDNTIVVYGNYETDIDVVISEIQIELDKVSSYTPNKKFGYVAGNTNGIEWIKYDDGRCELSGRVTIPATTDANVTFPFELINNEYSILLDYFYQYYALVFLTYYSMEKGGFTISAFQPTTEKLQYDQVVSFHVIGRWKDEITSSTSTMSLRPDTTEETTSLEEES